MYLNFKLGIICVVMAMTNTFAQELQQNKARTGVYVQLRPSVTHPVALGNNFLGKAHDLRSGFMGEARVFFPGKYYLGIHGNFFKSEVNDIRLAGNYDRTNVWHNYLTVGYSFLPRTSKFGLDLGGGVGYALYANRKGTIDFHDDGFSIMANMNVGYRLNQILGFGIGAQFSKDFLATETAPEVARFFKNANIVYLSAGLVFYINQ